MKRTFMHLIQALIKELNNLIIKDTATAYLQYLKLFVTILTFYLKKRIFNKLKVIHYTLFGGIYESS